MEYDCAVIGAGWAGYNAAIAGRRLGLNVVLIEQGEVGGTCLNRGCIPTKSLIQSAKLFALLTKSSQFGVDAQHPSISWDRIQQRKDRIVTQLRQGMQASLSGIAYLKGQAELITPQELLVGGKPLSCRSVLCACGSRPVDLPGLAVDNQKILSTDDIIALKALPGSLLIIGGGAIGCEFASLFCAFGVAVTIVEKMPQLLPGEEDEIARKLSAAFKKRGITVHVASDAGSFDLDRYDAVLVCVGRTPAISGVGLEKANVRIERTGIWVDEYLSTSLRGVWAAGDCTGKHLLAHYASYQGKLAMHNIARPSDLRRADNTVVPACVFTDPEIARVGMTRQQALASGYEVCVHRFDFLASGMARIIDETEGFISVVSDKTTGALLGASLIGPRAAELCATMSVAISNRLTVADVASAIIPHPTVSEAIHEALSFNGHVS